MRLLIVMVNYHGYDLTVDCLRSLREELDTLPDVHVGLCDNGSGEEEVQALVTAIEDLGLHRRVTLTPIYPNRGFTGGNNEVIRAALAEEDPPEAVLLLNNDTLVPTGAIQTLVEFLEQRHDVAVCGSRLEYPNGESQRAARRTLTLFSEFESYARVGVVSKLLSRWLVAPPERDEPHICGWVPGAALLVRREVFAQVGLLDEDLYTYFDDVDFCLRARRAGWPTWYVPASRIVHLVGQTTGITATGITATADRPSRRPSYWFWARRHYFLKNFGPLHATLADAAAIMGLCVWKLRCAVGKKHNTDPPHLLTDLVRHSVFCTGFRLRPVPNPTLTSTSPLSAVKVTAEIQTTSTT